MPPDDTPTSPVPIGTVLADKYVVELVLGVGGMGIVVAARHRVLDQRVALKFLHGEALADMEIVQRFLREARAVVKLESQFVARVSDVGVLDSGSPFIVMELLDGIDLAKRIEEYPEKGPLPVADAVDRILEALDALAEAHSHDIVHRDLKPANLFLAARADGTVATKVLDFGISKLLGSADAPAGALTRTMSTLGTPVYMSPEQVRSSKSVDVRADIWAIGVVLYEALSGQLPFNGESMGAVFAAIIEEAPASLVAQRPEVVPGLEAVVLRCLAKDRQNRYGDVAELAQALAPFGSGIAAASVARASAVLSRRDRRSGGDMGTNPRLPPAVIPAAHITATQGFAQPVLEAPPQSGRRRLVLAAGLGVAVVLASVALFSLRARPMTGAVGVDRAMAASVSPSAPPPPPEPESTGPAAVAPKVGVDPEPLPSASASAIPKRPAPAHRANHASVAPSATTSAPILPGDRL